MACCYKTNTWKFLSKEEPSYPSGWEPGNACHQVVTMWPGIVITIKIIQTIGKSIKFSFNDVHETPIYKIALKKEIKFVST